MQKLICGEHHGNMIGKLMEKCIEKLMSGAVKVAHGKGHFSALKMRKIGPAGLNNFQNVSPLNYILNRISVLTSYSRVLIISFCWRPYALTDRADNCRLVQSGWHQPNQTIIRLLIV